MIIIASFLASRSKRFLPPLPIGARSISRCTDFGMSFTCVKYWVIAPTVIWDTFRRFSTVGWSLPHFSSSESILSTMGVHIAVSSTLFPILAPRIFTDSPSMAMWMLSGIISVFATLNFALDARHHRSSISVTCARESLAERYTVVSSANKVVIILSVSASILYPLCTLLPGTTINTETCSKHTRGKQQVL